MQLRALALAALAGCLPTPDFSSDLDLDGPSSSGVGDGTIGLTVNILASANRPNARERDEFTTTYQIQVTRDGASAPDADVTVHDNQNVTQLAYDPDRDVFVGSEPGHPEGVLIDVRAGKAYAVGILSHGPRIHTISAPAENATVSINAPTTVTFDAEDTGGTITFKTPALESGPLMGSNTWVLDPGWFAPGPQQLFVTRTATTELFMPIPGGTVVPGGTLSFGVQNYVDVVGQ